MSHAARTLIVGLGSAHGDDQAGWLVAENLQRLCGESSDIIVRTALVPLDVLDWLEGIEVLHLCDAWESGSRESTSYDRPLLKFRWETGKLVSCDMSNGLLFPVAPAPFRSRGSHDFSVPEMLQLAAQLGTLPKKVVLWAIAGIRFQPGDVMSEHTSRTVILTTEAISRGMELQQTQGGTALTQTIWGRGPG